MVSRGMWRVQFGNEWVSECVHMVHVIGSVVDLFQEVLQLLDENALLEPLRRGNDNFSGNYSSDLF